MSRKWKDSEKSIGITKQGTSLQDDSKVIFCLPQNFLYVSMELRNKATDLKNVLSRLKMVINVLYQRTSLRFKACFLFFCPHAAQNLSPS
jgi:hypothetical protein